MESLREALSKCFPISGGSSSSVFRRHNNRISPEGSIRNVPPLARRGSDPNPSGTFREELNGEINIHFVGDSGDESHVVVECPNLGEYASESSPEHDIESFDRGRRSSVIDPSSSYGNDSYLTTIFIETAKNKTLRVVHFRAIEDDEDELDGVNENKEDDDDDSEDEEDQVDNDEEYWFSKWSQRTRLRKTVEEQNIEIRMKHAADEKQNNAEWKQKFLGPNEAKNNSKDATFSLPPAPLPSLPVIRITGAEDNDTRLGDNRVSEEEEENLENSFTNLAFEFDESDDTGENVSEENNVDSGMENGVVSAVNPEVVPNRVVNVVEEAGGVENLSVNDGDSSVGVVNNMKKMKPLLFFIHSISGSSDIWKRQINYFHKLGYEIAALDLLGHGLSGTPPQSKLYHFESLVQDVVVVFDHFIQDEHRQAVVIGHGYGACLATVLTRIRPKNVCTLVSISGGGPTPMVANYWCDFPWIPIPCAFLPKKKKKGRFVNPDLKRILPRNVLENLILGQIWLDGDPAFHRRITVPTLLVYGLRDTVVNLVEVCEMERTIPRAYLEIIPTAGHMVMWDEPRQLNRMIRKFIESRWS